jgi:hypothetical protein
MAAATPWRTPATTHGRYRLGSGTRTFSTLELAAMNEGADLKKLREIARMHIEKAAAGDMQAIKELRDTLDGRPAQVLEHSSPDSEPIRKVVREIVHVTKTQEQIDNEDLVIDFHELRTVGGNGRDNAG